MIVAIDGGEVADAIQWLFRCVIFRCVRRAWISGSEYQLEMQEAGEPCEEVPMGKHVGREAQAPNGSEKD